MHSSTCTCNDIIKTEEVEMYTFVWYGMVRYSKILKLDFRINTLFLIIFSNPENEVCLFVPFSL